MAVVGLRMNLYLTDCKDGVTCIHTRAIVKQESYPAAIPENSGSLWLPFMLLNMINKLKAT